MRSAHRGHFGCQTAVNKLDEALPSCSGRRAAAGGPSMQNHQWPPPGAQYLGLSSLDLVSSPEAELGKRKRLGNRDGKRHRRMESAPVRPAPKIFRHFMDVVKAGARRAPNDDTDPYTREDPVRAVYGPERPQKK